MKEATSDLSGTVIAIVAIAAIAAIFTSFLLPIMRSQIALTQACTSGPGYVGSASGGSISCGEPESGTTGISYNTSGKQWTCTYTDSEGTPYTKTCKN